MNRTLLQARGNEAAQLRPVIVFIPGDELRAHLWRRRGFGAAFVVDDLDRPRDDAMGAMENLVGAPMLTIKSRCSATLTAVVKSSTTHVGWRTR
jgi:hypothetical protein